MSYKNPSLDKLVDAARFETNPKKYSSEVKEFVKIAFTDVPRIPIFQPVQDLAMQGGISGYQYWFHRQLDLRQLAKN
jgi:peptide/nickel transport system substrate-binding protein